MHRKMTTNPRMSYPETLILISIFTLFMAWLTNKLICVYHLNINVADYIGYSIIFIFVTPFFNYFRADKMRKSRLRDVVLLILCTLLIIIIVGVIFHFFPDTAPVGLANRFYCGAPIFVAITILYQWYLARKYPSKIRKVK